MYLQEIVEVAIGLIFVWLVLSIATMQIQEWIATNILKWRAKDMETAIRNMLGDPVWANQLYRHPVVAGLSKKAGVKPSYISANKFAVALFDVIATAGTDGSLIQRELHKIKVEMDQTPDALFPLIRHLFKRWGKQIGWFFIRTWNFLSDAQIITKNEKYESLLLKAENAITSEEAMREFLFVLVSDEHRKITKSTRRDEETGKPMPDVRFTAREFLETYPQLIPLVYDTYTKFQKASYTWKKDDLNRISIENVEKITGAEIDTLLDAIKQALNDKEGLNLLKIFKFDDGAQGALERLELGMERLRKTNASLHRSINTLTLNLHKVTDNTTIMESVRNLVGRTGTSIQQQETKLANTRTEVETWFNDSMERLGGWYKRKSQFMAFVIGLILATILNVDTVALAKHLWKEPAVRQALAATSESFLSENQSIEKVNGSINPDQAIAEFQKRFDGLILPLGWDFYMWKADTTNPDQTVCSDLVIENKAVKEQVIKIPPPQNGAFLKQCIVIMDLPAKGEWAMKILGIFITGVAAMQGAPFWFDILKKLVNVRSTGANPIEKPKEEKGGK